MNQSLPQELDRESLNQLSKEQLVEIIIEQSKAIGELQKIIIELQQEIERLKVSRDLDSSNSSKPPSGDIHKKSENKKAAPQEESNHPKIKPGGQPGHTGTNQNSFTCRGSSSGGCQPPLIQRRRALTIDPSL